mgnify:CR=1
MGTRPARYNNRKDNIANRTVTPMEKEDVKDYLLRGLHGPPELRPEEKKRYLGEFRERVVLALSQKQVRSPDIPRQVEEALDRWPDVTIVLNGKMEYAALSKYIRLANERGVPYRKVHDQEHETDVGLVLAAPTAVDVPCVDVPDEASPDGPAAGNKAAPAGPAGKPPRKSRKLLDKWRARFHAGRE